MKELVYHRYLLPTVERLPDTTAVIDGAFRSTYAEHLDRVCRLAEGMRTELGVGPGDRFAVMALNGHEYLELYHASFLGGSVINPLNLRLAPKELSFILSDSGAKVCFVDGFFAALIDGVREEAGVEKVVMIGEGESEHRFESLIGAGQPRLPAGAGRGRRRHPHVHRRHHRAAQGGSTRQPGSDAGHLQGGDPLGDVRGLRLPAPDPDVPRRLPGWDPGHSGRGRGRPPRFRLFSPESVLDVIERDQVTMTVMVPTMIAMLLDHPAFRPERLKSLKVLTYGASPMPTALLERVLALFPDMDVYQGYGMTENCGLLTCLGPEEHRRGGDLLRSAGRPMPGSVISIRDEQGAEVSAGTSGEVCAKAGNYMREYWNRPDETEVAFRDGWYHTGDAGYVDSEGLPLPGRPGEGHDRDRRGERLFGGGGERGSQPSRGGSGGGHRHPVGAMGGGRSRHRRPATGRVGHRGRDQSLGPGAHSRLQGSQGRWSSAPTRFRCRPP